MDVETTQKHKYLHDIDIQSEEETCWIPLVVSESEDSEDSSYSPKDKPNNSVLHGLANGFQLETTLIGGIKAGFLLVYHLFVVLFSLAQYLEEKQQLQQPQPITTPTKSFCDIEMANNKDIFVSPENNNNKTLTSSEVDFLREKSLELSPSWKDTGGWEEEEHAEDFV